MQSISSADVFRRALVQAIRQKQPEVEERILTAFFEVPRHLFVNSFFERKPGKAVVWHARSQEEMEAAEWLQAVYQDCALTTRLDPIEQRFPASSSSQPGVMAAMLQALAMRKGSACWKSGRAPATMQRFSPTWLAIPLWLPL